MLAVSGGCVDGGRAGVLGRAAAGAAGAMYRRGNAARPPHVFGGTAPDRADAFCHVERFVSARSG